MHGQKVFKQILIIYFPFCLPSAAHYFYQKTITVAGIPGAESQAAEQPTGVMDCSLAGFLGSVQGLFGTTF